LDWWPVVSRTLLSAGNALRGGLSQSIKHALAHPARFSSHTIFCSSWEKITGISACGLKESLLVTVLPPPNLQYLIRMWLNGVELRNRLVGMDNGFYLQIEVTGNFRLGREILLTPYRLLCTLHEALPTSIHRYGSECYCFLPGRAFFLGCRCVVVQGEKKALESLLLSKLDRCCPDFRRDAIWFKSVHSAISDFQPVLQRSRYTVVAILLGLPAGYWHSRTRFSLGKPTFPDPLCLQCHVQDEIDYAPWSAYLPDYTCTS